MLVLLGVQALNGLVSGMILVMMAIGLSIIFGMLRIINFAHGVFFTLGVYISFSVALLSGNFWVGLLVGTVFTGTLGALVEFGLLRPLYGKDPHYQLLLTFGLALVIQELIKIVWGLGGRTTEPPTLLSGTLDVGFTYLSVYRLFLICLTAGLTLGIWLFLKTTKYGAIIRAGVQDPEMVESLGIDIYQIFTVGYGVGVALAGAAGTLMSPLVNIDPLMGETILVDCFVVVVIGGLGSFRGAVFGGLLVGEVVSLTSLVSPHFSSSVIFAFMAVFLLLRPEGLFGGKGVV